MLSAGRASHAVIRGAAEAPPTSRADLLIKDVRLLSAAGARCRKEEGGVEEGEKLLSLLSLSLLRLNSSWWLISMRYVHPL